MMNWGLHIALLSPSYDEEKVALWFDQGTKSPEDHWNKYGTSVSGSNSNSANNTPGDECAEVILFPWPQCAGAFSTSALTALMALGAIFAV